MRMPEKSASSRQLRKYSIYTTSRMNAETELVDRAAALQAIHVQLKRQAGAHDEAEEYVIVKQAERDAAKARLDRTVSRVSLTALMDCDNHRKDPRYVRVLPKGVSDIKELQGDEHTKEVKSLEKRIADEPDGAAVRTVLPELTQMREAAEKAQRALDAAEQEEQLQWTHELTARDKWRRAYKKAHGELIAVYPGDNALVESFFLPAPSRAGTKKAAKKIPEFIEE